MQVIDLSCPGCGAGVTTADKECKFCRRPITITSFSGVSSMSLPELNKYAAAYRKTLAEHPENQEINGSIALCYLKLKLYDNAIKAFGKAVEENFDNPEIFFNAAIALLRGKKAFLASLTDIKKAVEYLQAAIAIEPRGIFYYFLAYIKHDFYGRKCLSTSPSWAKTLQTAIQIGVTEFDIAQLCETLQVQMPEDF